MPARARDLARELRGDVGRRPGAPRSSPTPGFMRPMTRRKRWPRGPFSEPRPQQLVGLDRVRACPAPCGQQQRGSPAGSTPTTDRRPLVDGDRAGRRLPRSPPKRRCHSRWASRIVAASPRRRPRARTAGPPRGSDAEQREEVGASRRPIRTNSGSPSVGERDAVGPDRAEPLRTTSCACAGPAAPGPTAARADGRRPSGRPRPAAGGTGRGRAAG